ncbi:MAG: LacI family DNA-binding transcriptional regulator [Anaerolineae bacterium]|nr:LacI family DNA-binding transcriptional regulator [Anaerolineae bacterium]
MGRVSITIKDIARVAGVSHSTVSRALSDSPLISAETKERIRRLAEEMGYAPSALGRALVTRRSGTIGLVVTTITDPFIGEVVQGIEETALSCQYNTILCNSNSEPERELKTVRALREKRVDAIIVTSSRLGSLYLAHLRGAGVPIVLVNNQAVGDYIHSVIIDDLRGGEMAGHYLAGLGHRSIAYIGGPIWARSSGLRLQGCRAALARERADIPPELVLVGNGRPDGGVQAANELLHMGLPVTAIFCYNDMTAVGALTALHRAGVRVPEDVSVMGYDDVAIAAHLYPPLTTIAQPKYALGKRAMEMALALINGEPGVRDVVLPPTLVERASCQRVRA